MLVKRWTELISDYISFNLLEPRINATAIVQHEVDETCVLCFSVLELELGQNGKLVTRESNPMQRWLTLASGEGGVGGWGAPWDFQKWLPNRLADRAEILHSLWNILSATFAENFDWVKSGHGAMTS